MLDAVKYDAAEGAAVGSGSASLVKEVYTYKLPVLDAVKDDTAEGAAVGGPLLRGQVGQLVLLQLSLKPPQKGVSLLHF